MGWKHYHASPWGNVDICDHGCMRPHDSKEKQCIHCDYDENDDITLRVCADCKGMTYHLDGKCMRCAKIGL